MNVKPICDLQAFLNIVLAVCDPSDSVVLFKPYYFSHQIAFQMTGETEQLCYALVAASQAACEAVRQNCTAQWRLPPSLPSLSLSHYRPPSLPLYLSLSLSPSLPTSLNLPVSFPPL